jgi:hypothetical protein
MTPTATKHARGAMHLASLQAEYFGETFDRPFPRKGEMYFLTDEDVDPQDDLWFGRRRGRIGWSSSTARPGSTRS